MEQECMHINASDKILDLADAYRGQIFCPVLLDEVWSIVWGTEIV